MIVMKFGGTSITDSKAINRVINIIKSKPGKKIIVASAIAEGTNILTRAIHQNPKQYKKNLAAFKKRHEKIAEDLIFNQNLLATIKTKINTLFLELGDALEKASMTPENHERNTAKILAFGELLSSTILHAVMLEYGIKSTLIDARRIIITDKNYQQGKPLLEQITKTMPPLLNKYLNLGDTIVTQGFISGTSEGETTVLGREGSDYSASLIGMTMDAEEIQIWTDVDGIMTADPKKIKNTRSVTALSFSEAAELSSLGAKIIHPLTIEPAIQKNIPIRILNSLNAKLAGTLITKEPSQNRILSITYQENIEKDLSLISIVGKFNKNDQKTLENILKILDRFDVKMIEYSPSNTSIKLTLQNMYLTPAVQKLHDALIQE